LLPAVVEAVANYLTKAQVAVAAQVVIDLVHCLT
jgi:hypothetical protein